jgi:4-alpha-glucanotransferase
MKTLPGTRSLRELAGLYGVQTAYYDVNGQRRTASVESLLAALKAMDAPVETLADVPAAIAEYAQKNGLRPLEPVLVAWEGALPCVELRLPMDMDGDRLTGHIALEDGNRKDVAWQASSLPTLETKDIGGHRYLVKALPLQGVLPFGYHHLTIDMPDGPADAFIISAPTKSYSRAQRKSWGVFLPLYALHNESNWGSGTFSDLAGLIDWVGAMGGEVVATLPLLAAFLDEPFEPSPYAPASRLMWNAFYIDVDHVPEMQGSKSAQAILASSKVREEIGILQGMPLVDYKRHAALKRRLLEALLPTAREQASGWPGEINQFVNDHPRVEDYASFMAACEKQRAVWSQWPTSMRGGRLNPGDYDAQAKRYHIYTQWLSHQQMASLARTAQKSGSGLYLDLPLGVHPDGYDAWRYQTIFTHAARVGAPPDAFFTRGQDWGFPPLHPQRIREQGYGYIIDVIRHHLHDADLLRIDHVMGLHRLYWIPERHDARYGVYVRYPAEELYAILSLESHREQCWIIGENLGTVPGYVNAAMSRHGLGKMYVAQFEMNPEAAKSLNPVPSNAVASFNTHDMPMFATFWSGLDIENRRHMGLVDDAVAEAEKAELESKKQALIAFLQDSGFLEGQASPAAVYTACMKYLSTRSAKLLLINLEDLWQETQPQNVPGTGQEHPNWRRKALYAFQAFSQQPAVVEVLREIDSLRKR